MDNNALIEKIVGYIESNEQTRELMVRSFSGYPSLQKKLNISDEDKIKAARNLYMQSPADAEAVFGSIAAPKEEAAVAGRVMPDAANAANVSVEAMLAAEFRANM